MMGKQIVLSAFGPSWLVRVEKVNAHVWGWCHKEERKVIVSRDTIKRGIAQETLIHEMLHCFMPWMTEKFIMALGKQLDDYLEESKSKASRAAKLRWKMRRCMPYMEPTAIWLMASEIDNVLEQLSDELDL